MRKQRWPFEASAAGLYKQVDLLRHKAHVLSLFEVIEYEHRFHPTRLWRFDVAIPALRIGMEYQGGLFLSRRGGHQSVKGARRDWEKLNEAQICGWIVLQFGPDETRSGEAMNVIERAIQARQKGAAA